MDLGKTAVAVVIPCYNEERRVDRQALLELAAEPGVHLFLVNDGSTDDTQRVLEALQGAAPERITVIALASNRGKAEAVRTGMRAAIAAGADVVGYLDADMSTPQSEATRLIELLCASDSDVLIGARVALMGREIERKIARHYLGRLFATAASLVLRLRVYDTQCGAKFFRRTEALTAALAEPFQSRWVFDVELLARLTSGPHAIDPERIREEPLRVWRDVGGSKLRPAHMAGAAVDLGRIAWGRVRRRR